MSLRRVLLVAALCLASCSLALPVSSLQPICSVASASRPSKFPSGTQSYVASYGSYALYAETSFTTFINTMYNFNGQFLLAQAGSSTPAYYWNVALGVQGLLQYAAFHSAHGIGGLGWGSSTVISTAQSIIATQTESSQNDAQLRDAYNDDMSWMIHGLTLLYQSTSSTTYTNMAQTLLTTIQSSDDTTCCGSHPGGVWWDTAHTSKVTASQIGVAVAALRMIETGQFASSKTTLLAYAVSHYSFWKQYFTNSAGNVADHEDTSGTITYWGSGLCAHGTTLHSKTPHREPLTSVPHTRLSVCLCCFCPLRPIRRRLFLPSHRLRFCRPTASRTTTASCWARRSTSTSRRVRLSTSPTPRCG